MRKYIGLDVHLASTTLVVIDERGKLILTLVMRTDGQELRSQIASIHGPKELVFEEGPMSDWLYVLLKPVVDRLVVCDPSRNRRLWSESKSDAKDATDLAERLRNGDLKEVFHETTAMDTLRGHLRTYLQVNQDLTRTKNRLKALYRSRGIGTGTDLYHCVCRPRHIDLLDRRIERQRSAYLFEQLDLLTDQKQRAHKALIRQAQRHRGYRILKTAPGIGPIHAAKMLAVVVTPFRFRTKRLFWSYCGLAVVKRSSSDWIFGDKGLEHRRREQTLGLNNRRNPIMKDVFKQAALAAIRKPPFEEWYSFHIQRGLKPALARVTVARKLAAVTLSMWKKGVCFDPDQIQASLN